ncbi:MAG: L-ribulose-5-phosphate 3-epimerase [Spirochaetaceae bacterium]|nr:L-ribulose-5-phosphate 3-epimerase [Spirochaetaceae bacterium]
MTTTPLSADPVRRLPPVLGIYEKALPAGLDWPGRLRTACEAGYDFVEMSIDESDARLARLDWSARERAAFRAAVAEAGSRVPSICLSGHRRFPLGSADRAVRERGRDIMKKAIDLAVDVGIRTLQLAGYDVYYESSTPDSVERFGEGLREAVELAERSEVCVAMEIMDTPFMGTISRWLAWAKLIPSPWFQVYPDIGNLSAWADDVAAEIALAKGRIAAVHLKDTLRPGPGFPGKFRDLKFGEGGVDFPAAFHALDDIGYRGAYLLEMWTESSPDPIAEIRAAREWMLARMREGGIA